MVQVMLNTWQHQAITWNNADLSFHEQILGQIFIKMQ